MIKLNAKQLRRKKADSESFNKIIRNPIWIILDNVLDTYNIGSIFRLADAVAAEELIITGQAEIPPNTKIKKASINTTEWVKWRYVVNAQKAIEELRKKVPGIMVVAIEQDSRSIPYDKIEWKFPLAVIVGNESEGVCGEVLERCDKIVELPMWGVNKSLNVMVSLAIVLYRVMEDLRV